MLISSTSTSLANFHRLRLLPLLSLLSSLISVGSLAFPLMSSLPPSTSTTSVPRIDSITPIASTKWLSLQTLNYTDESGKERKWDMATRKKSTSAPDDTADAVVIVPLLRSSSNTKIETLLVSQFRPPLARRTIEFPAGLIDKNETPIDAALRELREETGFIGSKCRVVPQVSRRVCMSPGLTDESVHVVLVDIDLDDPYNHGTPKQELDEGEYVTVKRVDLNEGLKEVLDDDEGIPILGLYLFAMGLDIGKSLK